MNVISSDARIADLLGLLSILQNVFGGKADLYQVEKEMEVDVDDLMPIVYAANYMGFATVGEGDIIITDKGSEFLKSNIRRRKEILRGSLMRTEPFATALELGQFTIDKLMEALEKKGVQAYNKPEGRYELQLILLEWGVYSGLISRVDEETYKVNYDKS
ncbi:AAA-associated domain-containing protein [Metallosphaera hakonensis]|uniref:ABC transporter ATP-binding protein n=1 Tax=Metallosphaera hakonensis JCM 8857 = DSM 7519 TaxID=1293036 RepID=A0A2U9ISG0_9CREN|nr:AAA-associated domain-containing protein [Metallosphaera hakonensis]AWR98948.1 ABC transporter ATP-binding protein [Metallosphaera hakonensis JCM 8857 = DSM 7519]